MNSNLTMRILTAYGPASPGCGSLQRTACWFFVASMVLSLAEMTGATTRPVEFEPYQIILEREPFGSAPPPPPDPPPPEPEPEPPPREIRPEESFARNLRLTFMVREERGVIRVGIVNEREKKNYFMQVGDQEDGMELISVNYDEERVLLRYEDEEAWLSMRGDPLEAGRAGSMAPNSAPPQPRAAPPTSRYRRPRTPDPSRTALTREEYERTRAERPAPQPPRTALRRLRTEREDMPDIPDDATPEERRQLLREYNLDLIRAGGEKGPPLPIQLTDEEDAQLVREGVLPPME